MLVPDTASFFSAPRLAERAAADPNAAAVAVALVRARSLNSRAGAGSASRNVRNFLTAALRKRRSALLASGAA